MQKSFPASMESLYAMLQFILQHSQKETFPPEVLQKLELASEEALVNIINYSGLDHFGQIIVACFSESSGGIKIVIKDEGVPYNPLENVCSIDRTTPIEKRKIGGYGIHLIVSIMDKVSYRREGNFNVLTLIKYKN